MRAVLSSALLAVSSLAWAQSWAWVIEPRFVEGSITRAGGKEILRIVKDSSGKIVCLLGQNNFPIETKNISSHPLNSEGYSTRAGFYALRVGDSIGSILASDNWEYMRILDADGKEIAKFFAGAKRDKYSAKIVVGNPWVCELKK